MSVRKFLGRLFHNQRPAIATRLSSDQAVAIARAATPDDPLCEDLAMTMVEERDGKPVWIVSSATIGLTLLVVIDDENGRTLEVKRLGVR
jgi:hypothetical protein